MGPDGVDPTLGTLFLNDEATDEVNDQGFAIALSPLYHVPFAPLLLRCVRVRLEALCRTDERNTNRRESRVAPVNKFLCIPSGAATSSGASPPKRRRPSEAGNGAMGGGLGRRQSRASQFEPSTSALWSSAKREALVDLLRNVRAIASVEVGDGTRPAPAAAEGGEGTGDGDGDPSSTLASPRDGAVSCVEAVLRAATARAERRLMLQQRREEGDRSKSCGADEDFHDGDDEAPSSLDPSALDAVDIPFLRDVLVPLLRANAAHSARTAEQLRRRTRKALKEQRDEATRLLSVAVCDDECDARSALASEEATARHKLAAACHIHKTASRRQRAKRLLTERFISEQQSVGRAEAIDRASLAAEEAFAVRRLLLVVFTSDVTSIFAPLETTERKAIRDEHYARSYDIRRFLNSKVEERRAEREDLFAFERTMRQIIAQEEGQRHEMLAATHGSVVASLGAFAANAEQHRARMESILGSTVASNSVAMASPRADVMADTQSVIVLASSQ